MSLNRNASLRTKILVGAGVFVVVFGLARTRYLPVTSEGRRLARVDAARKHAMEMKPLLTKDARFDAVRVSEWYAGDGFFLVSGYVNDEADLRELKRIVESSNPPAPIAWQVKTVKQAETPAAVK